jgi:3'(2'), 5'-bisphosphate nucleotidase
MDEFKKLLMTAIQAAHNAGKSIMNVYETDFSVEHKKDESPLTLADSKAHDEIISKLKSTGIPVLSEEGKEIPFEERKAWKRLWIVDPLDGTKEFVKRNGEFTVNIALIENNYPKLGVIYVPVTGHLYFGEVGDGAWFTDKVDNMAIESWSTLLALSSSLPRYEKPGNKIRVVASRSHMSPETESFIREKEKHSEVELVSMGSSLKICLVAEGKADIYPRFAPTMEWDTAAGQAIAEAAGKTFIDWNTGERMKYNRENLLNNWFLVS